MSLAQSSVQRGQTVRHPKRRRLTDTHVALLLLAPAMTLLFTVILYPLLNSMYIGLLDKSLITGGDEFVGLENILDVLGSNFLPILLNTLVFAIGATLLPFLIGFGVALVLNGPIRGRGFWRGAFLLPWLVPSVIVSFLWLWIFNANYGVLNGILRNVGLIDSNIAWLSNGASAMTAVIIAKTWQTFPWIAIMILAALQTIPPELYEAASIAGANRWQLFRYVTMPHLRGVSSIVILLSLIWNFQHFETIYVMTQGGPAKATTTFSVAVYQTAFQAFDLGRAGALGILWMVLLSLVVVVYLRFGMGDEEMLG
ncbi:MAG: sugar ABC transporter permease [Caldilineaceae bacterium]|nr:sugar ABC transporter permease [Caldilineaceae bacterium]